MSEEILATRAGVPKLPWYGTYILLIGILFAALMAPLMPYGVIEYAHRMLGGPLVLDVGQGRSVKLVEEPALSLGCQPDDVSWSPDGTMLVTSCAKIQIWTLDGHEIAKSVDQKSAFDRMQIMEHPFRIAYANNTSHSASPDFAVTVWNVQTGLSKSLPVKLRLGDKFVVDQNSGQLATAQVLGQDDQITLMPLHGDDRSRLLLIHQAAASVRLVAGSQLLLGGNDGVLRAADIESGAQRELARPYTTSFPAGGGAHSAVEGLVPSPDNNSIAIYMRGFYVVPAPGSNSEDLVATRAWEATLGTTVEIRSVDDGRLFERMPGPNLGIDDLAWDPLDRFIAVVGHDALFLWNRKNGATAVRSFADSEAISESRRNVRGEGLDGRARCDSGQVFEALPEILCGRRPPVRSIAARGCAMEVT